MDNERLESVMQWVGINGEELRKRSLTRESQARTKYLECRFGRDPEYRKLLGMRNRFTSMLVGRDRRGSLNPRQTQTCWKLCGCSFEELRSAIEAKFYDGKDGPMTWENYGKGRDRWVLDHIKPICLFDWWTHKGRQEAFHHSNVQPLWYCDHKMKSVEDRALARLRKMDHPEYAARVEQWRVLPDEEPGYMTRPEL